MAIAATLAVGDVIHYFCLTIQQPKPKFGVLVSLSPMLGVFLINSEPAAFQKARSELMSLQLIVEADSHDFLTHDSYLDCSTFHGLPEECHGTVEVVGRLHPANFAQLSAIVGSARTLSGRQKQAISSALAGAPAPSV